MMTRPSRPAGSNALEIEDDLGERYGRVVLPNSDLVRPIVQGWSPRAAGNRPQDWFIRDLLHSAADRDRRMWLFRKLSHIEGPSWLVADCVGRSAREIKIIRRSRAFQLIHLLHCFTMRSQAVAEQDDRALAILDNMIKCWPVGVEVVWRGEGRRSPRDICQQAWHCSFCYARSIGSLHQRLQESLSQRDLNRFLITARIVFRELMIEHEPRDESFESAINRCRQRAKAQLKEQLKDVGALGGIVVSDVAPVLSQHQSWLDGEAVDEMFTELEFSVSAMAEIVHYSGDNPLTLPAVEIGGATLHPTGAIRTFDRGHLRVLLGGHGPQYSGKSRFGDGVGVFGWPSISLSDYSQWRRRLDLTWGGRHFDFWGSWRGRYKVDRPQSLPYGKRARRKRRVQPAINATRRSERLSRLDELAQKARPVWEALSETLDQSAGRVCLAKALEENGICASERDVRSLTNRFRNERESRAWLGTGD